MMFQLHGYTYNPYDLINYTIKLSLRKMTLTISKKMEVHFPQIN